MNKIKKLKINKKAIISLITGLGLSGAVILSSNSVENTINNFFPDMPSITLEEDSTNYGPTLDQDDIGIGYKPNYDGISERFNQDFHDSLELVSSLSDVYQPIADFVASHEGYFDDSLIQRLEDLQVKEMDDKKYGENVLAMYDNKSNTMFLKDKLRYKKEAEMKEIKEHEFFHFLFNKGFSQTTFNISHTGIAIDEGVATLLTQESGDYAGVVLYKENANYVRVLCELIGTDNFLKTYIDNSLDELYTYLSEYMSMADARKLITKIDEACKDYGIVKQKADKEAWELIDAAYTAKTGTSVKESNDPIMKYYGNALADQAYSIDEARSYLDVNVQKNYFLNISTPKVVLEHGGEVYGEIIYENGEYVYHPTQNKTY